MILIVLLFLVTAAILDLNARVDVNCGWKDRWIDGLIDRGMENRTPISSTESKKCVSPILGKIAFFY